RGRIRSANSAAACQGDVASRSTLPGGEPRHRRATADAIELPRVSGTRTACRTPQRNCLVASAAVPLSVHAWPRGGHGGRSPAIRTLIVLLVGVARHQAAQTVESHLSCLPRGGVMPDPMTDEERALLEHRWAVRVNLPGQASHAAQVARRLVDAAADAHLDAPAVVVRAVEALEGYAVAVHERVTAERAELQRRGVDTATFQQDL